MIDVQLELAGVPSSDKAAGSRCLFTNELLDDKTKIEHAIVHSLGGRVTSHRVISTTFNELSSQKVDPSAKLHLLEGHDRVGACSSEGASSSRA